MGSDSHSAFRWQKYAAHLCLAISATALSAVSPSVASAYATVEGPPQFLSTYGLPDARVYERVSPPDKNGNEAGAGTAGFDVGALNHYGIAAPDGESVLFEGTGPMGESPWAASLWFVAKKNQGAPDWSTRAVLPAAQQPLTKLYGLLFTKPYYLDLSPDLSHALAEANSYTLAPTSNETCDGQMFLAGTDPFVPATWLERPDIPNPVENCSRSGESGVPVGGSPNFSTVYFTYPGTLLPEDESRTSHSGSGVLAESWGFYESREGAIQEAGVLPDGRIDEFGAVPAASGHGRNPYGNEVSVDGGRAFFVSPDPASCNVTGGHNDCVMNPPELYVREDGKKTTLLSGDYLVPKLSGAVAPAPSGVLQMANAALQDNLRPALDGTYVFASPDGSQAFFQSDNQLTADAPSDDLNPKTYDFDVNTGTLRYLPGVSGQIIATDADGSAIAFVRPEAGGKPAEMDLWSGATVTPVTQLPGPAISGVHSQEYISEAQISSDGSVVAFTTASPLSESFNSGGVEQVYRYDAKTNILGCVSCPPAGVRPTGDTSMSVLRASETYEREAELTENIVGMNADRGLSADGKRIFFDSPDPLVPADSNSDSPPVEVSEDTFVHQGRDVYEWENGVVYLISTGKSARDSYLLDSSENGDDVFFATAEGLVPGDTDGGFDVYDARVPRGGDNPAAEEPASCQGSSCQGPPNVSPPASAVASATVTGAGNQLSAPPGRAITPSSNKARKRCRRGYVKRTKRCVKKARANRSAKGERGIGR